ncbi:hypothetical protein ACOMHN_024147 [Nucella lapillus]
MAPVLVQLAPVLVQWHLSLSNGTCPCLCQMLNQQYRLRMVGLEKIHSAEDETNAEVKRLAHRLRQQGYTVTKLRGNISVFFRSKD